MKKLDGRKLKHEVLEAMRIRAVLAVERGESPEAVIKSLGMTRGCIYKWIAKYHEGGIEHVTNVYNAPFSFNGVYWKSLFFSQRSVLLSLLVCQQQL